jgi:putative spermidine/putrescine transport system ATP-binding protein
MTNEAAYAIALQGVSFSYPGTDAGVRDIDLSIRRGELLAVIGASGCGKSTLLKIIAGFIQPSHGRVMIDGNNATFIPPRLRNVGIVFSKLQLVSAHARLGKYRLSVEAARS